MKRVKSIIGFAGMVIMLSSLSSCTGLLVSSDLGYDDFGPSGYVPGYYGSPYGVGYNPPPTYYNPGWNNPVFGPPIAPAPPMPIPPQQRPDGVNRPNYVPSTPGGATQPQQPSRPTNTTAPNGQMRPGNMGQPQPSVSGQPSGSHATQQPSGNGSGAHRVH